MWKLSWFEWLLGWSQPVWQRPLILLGFPEWRWPRYCQGRIGRVVALDEAHAIYLISTVRKPAGRAVAPGGGGDLFACSAGDPHRSADRITALPPASTACFPRSPASGESRNRVCGRVHGSPHRRSILARRGAGSARHRSRTASARPARDEPRNASCGCWAGMSGRPVDRFGSRPFAHSTKKSAGPTFVARQFCSLTLGGGFSTFLFAS